MSDLISFEDLEDECAGCRRCDLWLQRPKEDWIAFCDGPLNSPIFALGEAPGRNEIEQGVVFIGKAGQFWNDVLEATRIMRENVFVMNAVVCRPPGNRDPNIDEISACHVYWHTMVDIIQPKVILALGKISMRAITGMTHTVRQLRTDFHERAIRYTVGPNAIPVVPTYHPSYLMRGSTEQITEKVKDVAKDYVAVKRIAGV